MNTSSVTTLPNQVASAISRLTPKQSILLILLLTTAAYATTLRNGFILDDYSFIANWPAITQPAKNFAYFLQGGVPYGQSGIYRPIRSLLYAASYQLWGKHPAGYHFQALLIHLCITTLVYLITRRLTDNQTLSFWSAAIFGVHPIHTEAISWVTASFDTVGIFFLLLSFWLYLLHYQHPSPPPHLLKISLFASIIASFTYEITLVYPALLLAHYYAFTSQPRFRDTLTRIKPYLTGPLLYILIKFFILALPNRSHPFLGTNPFISTLVMSVALIKYLWLTLLPQPPAINRHLIGGINNFFFHEYYSGKPIAFPSLTTPAVALSLLLLGALALFSLRYYRRFPLLTFGLAWFFISLLPVMQVFSTTSLFTERYPYLGSAMLLVSLTWLTHKLVPKPAIFTIILISYTTLASVLTLNRNLQYHTPISFWTATLAQSPRSSFVYSQLARAHWEAGNLDRAKDLILKAVDLNPSNAVSLYNLAAAYSKTGDYEPALELLNRSIKATPKYANSYILLGDILRLQGKPEESLEPYQTAIKLNPEAISAYINLASSYQLLDQIESAETTLKKALSIAPEDPRVYLALGAIYHQQGLYQKATSLYLQGLGFDPNHPDLLSALSRAQNRQPWQPKPKNP